MKRNGSAKWQGPIKEGQGTLVVGDGVFAGPYSFASRFEEGEGTNPEELIAAAHAGCFALAFSGFLGAAGHEPDSLDAEADVHVNPRSDGEGFEINRIDLRVRGRVPGISAEEFTKQAQIAKENCPVSRALAGVPEITLEAQLED